MTTSRPPSPTLVVEPIGYVRSALTTKVDAPRQPRVAAGHRATIELLPGRNFEHALEHLAEWEYLWVIFWFHLNRGWRPKVLPPRSTSGRKGVFATRAPHRPNPIGLSAVRLERIEGLTLHICDVDMLDGTPVLDLKPYVAYADAHPAARSGWLDGAALAADPVEPHFVAWSALAAEQARWVEEHTALALRERVDATLALGPEPHPYRRIRRIAGGVRLAVREWRLRCACAGREITVLEVGSGFRASELEGTRTGEPLDTHRAFLRRWPRPA